jgi:sulfonate transport system substrate-binding protein
VLEQAGLTPADVTVIYLNPGDAKAAFSAGSIDAWATWGAYVGQATLHDHARVLADGRGLLSGVGFEAANDAAIAAKSRPLVDFLHRLAQAERWEADHKAEFAQVLAKETGLPPDVALYTVSQARGAPAPIDAGLIDEERQILARYAKAGVIASAPNIDGAFDPAFNNTVAP